MSAAPTISGEDVRIGPGRLVLVVGPSGAGKDTLLTIARTACATDREIVFARRIVTREASPSEDNHEIDHDSFQSALARGQLAVHWEAHGHRYALPRSIDDEIRAGRVVVANVSRMVVDAMRRVYVDVVVIEITAPPDVLAHRLAMRRRDSDGALELRLRRSAEVATVTADVTIVNVGDVETHARRLIALIKGDAHDRPRKTEERNDVDHRDDRTA